GSISSTRLCKSATLPFVSLPLNQIALSFWSMGSPSNSLSSAAVVCSRGWTPIHVSSLAIAVFHPAPHDLDLNRHVADRVHRRPCLHPDLQQVADVDERFPPQRELL